MSGESTARSDKSEKKKNNNNSNSNSNNPSESVPLAEHELLKEKYETLTREHETLIKTLELLEKKHGFTLEDLEKKKKQREAVVAEEEVEKWEKKFGELQMKLEKVEKDIEDLKSLDETGMDSGSAEKLNVNCNNVSIGGKKLNVIEISDDDEGNQSESDRGHSNQEYSFFL